MHDSCFRWRPDSPMYDFDSKWLEGVNNARNSSYRKIDLERAAQRIYSLFIQFLGMEAWKFTGHPPVHVHIKPIGAFPWMEHRWNSRIEGRLAINIPVNTLTYPIVRDFGITLAPKFLKADEDGLLTLMDYVMFGDKKSAKALKETFAGPGFGKNRGRRPERHTFESKGLVYDLEDIRKKVEKEFLDCRTRVRIMWGSRVWAGKMGHYEDSDRRVVVNPALDDPKVPFFVVEHVVFHELLHDLIPSRGRVAHHKAFKEAEREYPYHEEARSWVNENWKRLVHQAKQRKPPRVRGSRSKPRDMQQTLGTVLAEQLAKI